MKSAFEQGVEGGVSGVTNVSQGTGFTNRPLFSAIREIGHEIKVEADDGIMDSGRDARGKREASLIAGGKGSRGGGGLRAGRGAWMGGEWKGGEENNKRGKKRFHLLYSLLTGLRMFLWCQRVGKMIVTV